jgi:hypothetical protein
MQVNFKAKRKKRPVPLARDLEVNRARTTPLNWQVRVYGDPSQARPLDLPAGDLHAPSGRQFRDHALINSGRPLFDPEIGRAGRYRPE